MCATTIELELITVKTKLNDVALYTSTLDTPQQTDTYKVNTVEAQRSIINMEWASSQGIEEKKFSTYMR